MKLTSYMRGAFATTFNIILNALTLGRYVWLEGRVRNGVFRNWAGRFQYNPKNFVQPTSEAEIVGLVKNSRSLRVFGSAHSFNGGVIVDDTLVSLDRYSGVIWKNLPKKQLAVRAGTRVRDVVKTEISDLSFVEDNLERLLKENDHFSLYLFPFTTKCQINTWNRTSRDQSFLGTLREFLSISMDALLAAWFGNLVAYTGLLPALSSLTHSIKKGTNLVLESSEAFNRTIYHLHQELEFTVHYEDTFEACRRFIELYEKMYSKGLPYTIFEVRFTPAGHDRTLIGAGRERRSTWVDLVCNDSAGFEKYYAAAETDIKRNGARPHLGKYCENIDRSDLERLHQAYFVKFEQLVEQHDPKSKFANEFTRRLFAA